MVSKQYAAGITHHRYISWLSTIFGILISLQVSAQVTLRGTVVSASDGKPLPGATIYIPDLKTGTASDVKGQYTMTNLPSTTLLLQVSYMGYTAISRQIDLRKQQQADFSLTESAIESREVVITGSGVSTDNSRSSITITPVQRWELLTTPSTNIIDAISEVPGMSEITTGGAVSKPVIRGLSYNHVVTLNEGIRQEDQQWGDEHGIVIDQFSADRIEVLKGPASLFYGSDAMGGVINILEPMHAPLNTIRGELISQFATNNLMTSSSLMLEGNQSGFIWRGRISYKNAASYKTPPEYVYNSGFNELNYSAMVGLNKRWGFTHLHFSNYNGRIGMVEGARDSATGQFLNAGGEIVTASEAKSRALELPFQQIVHKKLTSVTNIIKGNSQFRVNLGYQVNDREEFEEDKTNAALNLHLNTFLADIKFTHTIGKNLEFVAGISGMNQTDVNKGEEYLIPDYTLNTLGGFLYAKRSWTKWTLNAGIRYDVRWVEGMQLLSDSLAPGQSNPDTIFPGFKNQFGAISGSAGFTWSPSDILNLKFNLGSGFRAPNIAELGSNGVHPGTIRYEIGNPDLNAEQSLQVDGAVTADWRWLSATLSGYYNYIFNYIYQRNINGEVKVTDEGTYPVYRFVQGNSVLTGFELEVDIHPIENLHFENSLDYVLGTNVSSGSPLPFIPALHMVNELRWNFSPPKRGIISSPYIALSFQTFFAQKRIDPFETTSQAYLLLDASAGMQLKVQRQLWTIFISGKNMTNQKYMDHLSRLQEVGVYNPGWNITMGLVIPFGIYEKPL